MQLVVSIPLRGIGYEKLHVLLKDEEFPDCFHPLAGNWL